MLRLMPKMFALRAVQRHTAASRSTNPPSREQQELVGRLPSLIIPSTSAHPPFSASFGHLVVELGGGGGGGDGQLPFGGGGEGGGGGGEGVRHAP